MSKNQQWFHPGHRHQRMELVTSDKQFIFGKLRKELELK